MRNLHWGFEIEDSKATMNEADVSYVGSITIDVAHESVNYLHRNKYENDNDGNCCVFIRYASYLR